MAKTISEIYNQYKIPTILQEHMLRVAAVAYIICDNSTEPLLKDDVVVACLFHDMGNIIKFKMDVFPEAFEPEGVEYWKKVQEEYVEKYGPNEVEATEKIMKEVGLSDDVSFLAMENRFSLICDHKNSNNMAVKIVHYSDGRVSPHGVVSYEDRMAEAGERYKDGKYANLKEERDRLVNCGLEMEKQIFAKCKIKPEDITDETVAPIIEELKNFKIK